MNGTSDFAFRDAGLSLIGVEGNWQPR